jgi:hypothetical protein
MAVNTITGNQAFLGLGSSGGAAGGASAGNGGVLRGFPGTAEPGTPGVAGVNGVGIGGGLDLFPNGIVRIDTTNVTGNFASTGDNDTSGTFSV